MIDASTFIDISLMESIAEHTEETEEVSIGMQEMIEAHYPEWRENL